jgi:O-antigen/teichoic acid export membrane protein
MTDPGGLGPRGAGRVLQNGLIVWGRIAGTTLATILTTRFVLAALGVEAYGVFVAAVAIPLALSFMTGAMQTNSQRALAMTPAAPGNRQRIFNATLGLHLGVALVVLVAGELAGGWVLRHVLVIPDPLLAQAEQVLRLTVVASALGAFLAPYEALLQADERFAVFAILDVLRAAALMAASLWLMSYGGERMVAYGWATALTTGGAAMLGALIAARGHPDLRIRLRLFFDAEIFRTQTRLFSWTLFGSVSSVTRNQGMVIVVNILFGPVGSAAYGVGNQLLSALRQLSGAISTVLAPRIFRIAAHGQRERMVNAALASCRLSSLVAMTFAVPLLAEIDMLLALWLGTPPQMAEIVAMLLIVGFLIDQLSAPVGMAHLAVGSIARYQLVCGSLTIAFLPLAYVMGAEGAGLALILSLLAGMTGIVAWARIALLEPHSPGALSRWISNVVRPVLAAAAPAGIAALTIVLLLPPGPVRLVLTGVLSGAVLLASGLRFGLTSEERAALATLLARWRT